MKSIIVVSPDYLEPIFQESKKFSFVIHGYGNPEKAKKGLLYVNVSEILGISVVYDVLPAKGSDEYNALIDFVRACNLLESNKKLVIVTRGKVVDISQDVKKLKNLRVVAVQDLEYITDIVINQSIFGSILLDNYEPYLLKDETSNINNEIFSTTSLEFKRTIPDYIFKIFDKVSVLDTVEDTLLYDKVFQDYKVVNPVIAEIRRVKILKDLEHDYQDAAVKVMDKIEKLDMKMRCLCFACLTSIIESKNSVEVLNGC